MNPNSLKSYENIKKSGRLRVSQMRVYSALITLRRATMHEVADHLNAPLHTISGRFGELIAAGYLQVIGQQVKRYGNKVYPRAIYETVYTKSGSERRKAA